MQADDQLLAMIAQEVGKSPIVVRKACEMLVQDPSFIRAATELIDPKIVSKALAERIYSFYTANITTLEGDSARTRIITVMREAEKLAAQMVAEYIAEETRAI